MFSDGDSGRAVNGQGVVIVPAIQGEALVNPQNRIEDACVGVLGGRLAFDVRVGDLFGDQQSSGQIERQDDGVSTPGHQG